MEADLAAIVQDVHDVGEPLVREIGQAAIGAGSAGALTAAGRAAMTNNTFTQSITDYETLAATLLGGLSTAVGIDGDYGFIDNVVEAAGAVTAAGAAYSAARPVADSLTEAQPFHQDYLRKAAQHGAAYAQSRGPEWITGGYATLDFIITYS